VTYKTIDVEIDLDEWNDKELISEMKSRGYHCFNSNLDASFTNDDWDILLKLIDSNPKGWELDRVRDKIRFMRHGL
jgi:hypothetical protein